MALTISDLGQQMLDDMHPWQADDPLTQNILSALGNEIDYLQSKMADVWTKWLPQSADDTYHTLTAWEMMVGIVTNPALTLQQRLNLLLAYIVGRDGSRTTWVNILSTALGTTNWTYTQGPGDYQITLTLPSRSGNPVATQIVALAASVTPAHLQVFAGFTGGFLVGVSSLGVEPL